jgi:DNA-binding CsgD family transcriptional regulator
MDSNKEVLLSGPLQSPSCDLLLFSTTGHLPDGTLVNEQEAPIQKELEPRRLPVNDYLKQVFRFTPAEVEFTKLLLAGKSVAECAAELNVSVHTARSHLKKAMFKTNTNRQGALIGLLLRKMNLLDGH